MSRSGSLLLAVVTLLAVLAVRSVETHNPVTTTVRFNREIAPILFAKCAPCHVEGGPAMSLLTYDEVRPWAQAIKEEVLMREMPPWPARRGYGNFANDRSLTSREREFLLAWLDGGVPRGDDEPPSYVDHSGHWMLGSPDRIRQAVADEKSPSAGGRRRFIVNTGFQSRQFVRAIDIRVDKRTTRAAFLWLVDTGQYLGGWMPGHSSIELPGGVAFQFPARARVAIDVIESPQGPPGSTPPEIAIYAGDKSRIAVVTPLAVKGTAAAGERRVRARQALTTARTLVGFSVDSGGSAKSVQLIGRRPDGSVEPLLWMRTDASEWPVPFVFREPVSLPAGTVLEVIADYADTTTVALQPGPPPRVAVSVVAYQTPR